MKDVKESSVGWVNLYLAAAIPVGSGLLIQNKSMGLLLIREQASEPAVADMDGRFVPSLGDAEVDAGSPGVWVRGASVDAVCVNVQEV